MDKKQQKKDNTFDTPSDDIQAKITELMGLPADKAEPTLNKINTADLSDNNTRDVSEHININIDDSKNFESTTQQETSSKEVGSIESKETDDAVIDILKKESDELIDNQDKKIDSYKLEGKPKKGIGRVFSLWWNNKRIRYASLLVICFALAIIFIVPNSRYAILNKAGIRSSASFIIVDKISGRPVKNVDAIVGEQIAKSHQDGSVKFDNLKLGKNQLKLQKRSFEPLITEITIGWGSNPFESPIEVNPSGTSFKFTVIDWIDGLPIKDAEVTDEESVGLSNDKGEASIKIEPTDNDLTINISATGYRTEQVVIPADSTEARTISLVAAKPDIFISQRSGKYDLYKRDIDGKNEIMVLPATGNENIDTYAIGHPSDYSTVALVSSRAGNRNDDGYMLSDLYIVDIPTKTAKKIESTESERIRLIGWESDKLIFVKTVSGPSATFSERQRIIAYDYKKLEIKELASANYFTDVRLIDNTVYFASSSAAVDSAGAGLSKINTNSSDKRVLIAGNIWAVYRSEPNKLVVSAEGDKWYDLDLSSLKISQLKGSPPLIQDYTYATSPDKSKYAIVAERDGKTEIIIRDMNTAKEELIIRKSGISQPIEWATNKIIVFGVNNSDETARYTLSIFGEGAKKIGENTASIYDDRPYY